MTKKSFVYRFIIIYLQMPLGLLLCFLMQWLPYICYVLLKHLKVSKYFFVTTVHRITYQHIVFLCPVACIQTLLCFSDILPLTMSACRSSIHSLLSRDACLVVSIVDLCLMSTATLLMAFHSEKILARYTRSTSLSGAKMAAIVPVL